jgi:hypothetical protein
LNDTLAFSPNQKRAPTSIEEKKLHRTQRGSSLGASPKIKAFNFFEVDRRQIGIYPII